MTVSKLIKKSLHIMGPQLSFSFHKIPPLNSVLPQVNTAQNLTIYDFHIQKHSQPSVCQDSHYDISTIRVIAEAAIAQSIEQLATGWKTEGSEFESR
jgi:hypothetical protein